MGSELKVICLKEAKSSCNLDCGQLAAVGKELLNEHEISLGAVNVGSAISGGESLLVSFVFRARRDINGFIIPPVLFGVRWLQ